eukprot:Skav216760  [mRNA]  locus=scaffold1917:19340:21342:+ [translate_table: standard]
MANGLSIAWVSGEGGNRCTPRLCVYLHRSEEKLSRTAHQLLDTCLEKVPGAPERKDFFKGGNPGKYREDVKHSAILQELHADGLFKEADFTALGWLQFNDVKLEAVALGPNLRTRDRAFSLALSLTVLMRLQETGEEGPTACIINNFGQVLNQILDQARAERRCFGARSQLQLPTEEEILEFQLALCSWPRGNPRKIHVYDEPELEEV